MLRAAGIGPQSGPAVRLTAMRPLLLAALLALASPAAAQAPAETMPLASRSLTLAIARAGDRLVAVGERGHVLLSDDNGKGWRQAPAPANATLTAIAFAGDGRTGYAAGHDGVILGTGDGGQSWNLLRYAPDAELPQPVMALLPLAGGRVLAAGAYGLFLVSDDAGASWRAVEVDPEGPHLNGFIPLGDGRILLVGEFGGIWRSADRGESWERLDSPYGGSFFGGAALDDGRVAMWGLQGHLYLSADAGDSWAPVETDASAGLFGGAVYDGDRLIVVGQGGLVLEGPAASPLRLKRADRATYAGAAPAADGGLVLVGEAGPVRLPPAAEDAP